MAFGNSFNGGISGGSGAIADGSVTTAKLADNSVATAKIIDANVTPAKLNGAQSGSAPIFGVRAWVNFNGTGTVAVRASGNVSSITDNGTGDYTVNFTTAMPDANYAVVCQVGGTGGEQSPITADQTTARTASSFRFASITGAGAAIDCAQLGVMVIR